MSSRADGSVVTVLLVLEQSTGKGRSREEILLSSSHPTAVVGNAARNPDADILVASEAVSRVHCTFSLANAAVTTTSAGSCGEDGGGGDAELLVLITDGGPAGAEGGARTADVTQASRNGTEVNGRELRHNGRPHVLHSGDRVRLAPRLKDSPEWTVTIKTVGPIFGAANALAHDAPSGARDQQPQRLQISRVRDKEWSNVDASKEGKDNLTRTSAIDLHPRISFPLKQASNSTGSMAVRVHADSANASISVGGKRSASVGVCADDSQAQSARDQEVGKVLACAMANLRLDACTEKRISQERQQDNLTAAAFPVMSSAGTSSARQQFGGSDRPYRVPEHVQWEGAGGVPASSSSSWSCKNRCNFPVCVLDTNVLLDQLSMVDALLKLKNAWVVVPHQVCNELERLQRGCTCNVDASWKGNASRAPGKSTQGEACSYDRAKRARDALRFLRSTSVSLAQSGSGAGNKDLLWLAGARHVVDWRQMPRECADDEILACAIYCGRRWCSGSTQRNTECYFVSEDKRLLLKAGQFARDSRNQDAGLLSCRGAGAVYSELLEQVDEDSRRWLITGDVIEHCQHR